MTYLDGRRGCSVATDLSSNGENDITTTNMKQWELDLPFPVG